MALDRYAYVNNSPLNYTDPTGHYGREVHYVLTWCAVFSSAYIIGNSSGVSSDLLLSLASGFADQVAAGDMAADMMDPDGSVNLKYIENNPILPPGIYDSNYVKQPHWYTTPDAQKMLTNAETPFEFGTSMHMYQDSFSHWQRLGYEKTPSGIWLSHFKDNKYKIMDKNRSTDVFDPANDPFDAAMWEGMQVEVDKYVREMVKIWESHEQY